MAEGETRCAGVTRLGVGEYVWHHVSTLPIADRGGGPKEVTGMVDLPPTPKATRRYGCSTSCPVGRGRRLESAKSEVDVLRNLALVGSPAPCAF